MKYYWWTLYKDMRTQAWEAEHSSYKKLNNNASYQECREFACRDISQKTWCDINENSMIVEIPKGKEWHFIGRVATTRGSPNTPEEYYDSFNSRKYISFSTINNKNISRYRGCIFYIYNIMPEDIVHVFPMDSDLDRNAQSEEDISGLPSLWIGLEELENMTLKFRCYNQVTCKTHRNGEIIKPIAVAAFGEITKEVLEVSKKFGITCLLCHPDKDAVNYNEDMLFDPGKLMVISKELKKLYNIDVKCMEYF